MVCYKGEVGVPVAQLDKASPSGGEDCAFDPHQGHIKIAKPLCLPAGEGRRRFFIDL